MATAPQPTLPMFYNDLMPLNTRDHAKWRARAIESVDFLKDVHAVPLTVDEFVEAQRELPIIFSAGDERIMSENSLFLIHKVSSCSWGNENDLQAELETHKVLNERLVNLYHGISIKTKEDIEALM